MKKLSIQNNTTNEWQMLPVGDVFTFVKSYAFSRDNLVNGTSNNDGIGNIHYGDIHATYFATSIDLREVSVPMIKDNNFIPKSEDFLKDGDLIMADVSEDYEGIGVTVSVHGLGSKKIVGGLHTFVLRDNKNITDKYFRQYIFRNPIIRNSLQKVANGVSVYGISKTALSKLLIPIPPLSEQKRIVSVFKAWDQSIEKLTNKIKTKKLVKKALMQDLLTGKKRLSGFKNKWETVKLGDVSVISRGDSITKKDIMGGDVPVIAGGQQPAYYHNESNREGLTVTVSGSGAYAGYVDFYSCPIFVSDGMSIQEKDLDITFIYYFLKLNQEYIYSLQAGGAQPHIYPKDLKRLKLRIPTDKNEQVAVARVLTMASKEISELEKKLAIITSQKKYLLNNLITGIIRTPETLSIVL